ncbi:hypothetical protein GCM10022226_78730 [Sphaerisporangium flaviroseum]|uniref:Uncharacterized protein n=1 Tax=Sphaerisporangium flaviroseum TaxID=509199 RepID=A0ABP7JFS5_9ACTN
MKFWAGRHTFVVAELLGPPRDEVEPWWTEENLGRPLEDLRMRHYLLRALGACGGTR